jgi:hypothetical protein
MHSTVRKQLPQLPAQSVLSSAFMAKNAFIKTRILLGSRFNDYRYFELKYNGVDKILENKNGLWTYKKTKAIIFTRFYYLTHPC